MTTTYDLTTDTGKVRLAIGDINVAGGGGGVKPDGSNFSDEEIAFVLGEVSRWEAAVPILLRILANFYATQPRTTEEDHYSETFGDIVKDLREQAAEWDTKLASLSSSDDTLWGGLINDISVPAYFGNTQWGAEVEDQREVTEE